MHTGKGSKNLFELQGPGQEGVSICWFGLSISIRVNHGHLFFREAYRSLKGEIILKHATHQGMGMSFVRPGSNAESGFQSSSTPS